MLDSKKLEYFLRLLAHHGNSSLVPKEAGDIRVLNIKKLSGGMANNVYSFTLEFRIADSEKAIDLVLKGYTHRVSLWFRAVRPDAELRRYVREFDIMQALARADFPVPKAYFCETDSFFLGYPFLIMQHEKPVPKGDFNVHFFASALAKLHKLDVNKLEIKSLRIPQKDSEFANERIACLKTFMSQTRHYGFLRKNFDFAINWLDKNSEDIICRKYCLIHGEYHPGHTVSTKSNRLTVIDWESSEIGDPAFDVAYAYNLLKVQYKKANNELSPDVAETFLSDYSMSFHEDFKKRFDFYKVISLLGVAVTVSSWIADPIDAYRSFGREALARALAFPFLHSIFLTNRWLNQDFLLSYLQYCQDFIKETLRE